MDVQFYEGIRSERMPFIINDGVEVLSGACEGKKAAVISIGAPNNGMSYLIEFGDGSGDLLVSARLLKLI